MGMMTILNFHEARNRRHMFKNQVTLIVTTDTNPRLSQKLSNRAIGFGAAFNQLVGWLDVTVEVAVQKLHNFQMHSS